MTDVPYKHIGFAHVLLVYVTVIYILLHEGDNTNMPFGSIFDR